MTGSPQCRGDALVEHPADRQVNNALAETLFDPIELAHGGQILCEPGLAEFRVGAPQIVTIEYRIRPHSSGQQPSTQRSISQHRNSIFLTVRQEVGLDTTLEQIVGRLQYMQG